MLKLMPEDPKEQALRELDKLVTELESRVAEDTRQLRLAREARARLKGWEIEPEGDRVIHFVEAYLKVNGRKAKRSAILAYLIERGVAKDTRSRQGQVGMIKNAITKAASSGRVTATAEEDPLISLP